MHLPKLIVTPNFIKRLITSFALGACFWLSFAYFPPLLFSFILVAILALIIAFEFQNLFDSTTWHYWIMLPFYPTLPFILLIMMNQDLHYHQLLLELFVIVASFDTGSYIVGNLFGAHKVIPRISPLKSWEGLAGGYIFSVISLIFVVWYKNHSTVSLWTILGFNLIVCSLAFAGDLFESFLKRRANIKHSGNFLPGHGGFLDRFDGIMFAVFFFYIFRDQIMRIFG